MSLQHLFDAMSASNRMARKDYHLTLGSAIEELEKFDPHIPVEFDFDAVGPYGPHSYRGYYSDLAFKAGGIVTVSQFLKDCRQALGNTFQGYKGGDFLMDKDTPLWQSVYGQSSGRAIIAMTKTSGKILLVTKLID